MPANDKRVVKVQNRSGFDKSFRSTLTADVGTLVPILLDEVIPDTKVNLRINVAASMPPLVSDTYMNVRLRVEAFAVPHRICMANFEDFFSDYPVELLNGGEITRGNNGCIPLIALNSASAYSFSEGIQSKTKVGSLCDYFGIETHPDLSDYFYKDLFVPVLPFVAYHLIWQEWYRNPRVQNPAFLPEMDSTYPNIRFGREDVAFPASTIPFTRTFFLNGTQPTVGQNSISEGEFYASEFECADGVSILSLRQRNFGLDFFTAAMVEPQQGEPARVIMGENPSDPANGFTIASLRAQNSIQQFRERNNLTSPRYQQQLYARYGVAPSDGVIQRPVLIGAATYDVYSHGVTANSNDSSQTEGKNPFNGLLGQRGANAFASGSDFIISNFHAKEPMYIIVLASLVPEVSYSQNLNFVFNRYKGLGSITDMANNILQNVGPQPITDDMLSVRGLSQRIFAYTDRYSDWMFKNNEIHGKFKYGENLQSFVLQRYFSQSPEFGTEFLEIPKTYLDDVLSVTSETMGFGYWMDIAFDYKVSMPIQEYAIPTLQDPAYEHGHSIVLRKNGQLL